jgi:hypothetical protein
MRSLELTGPAQQSLSAREIAARALGISPQNQCILCDMPPIPLRDCQSQCLAPTYDRYKAGARRQLICLPTRTSKTALFAQFPSFFRMKRRMLVLAHRAECSTRPGTNCLRPIPRSGWK